MTQSLIMQTVKIIHLPHQIFEFLLNSFRRREHLVKSFKILISLVVLYCLSLSLFSSTLIVNPFTSILQWNYTLSILTSQIFFMTWKMSY